MLTACLAFAAVAALLTITPGVDTMLVLRSTVTGGRRAGLLASTGVVTGLLCWAMTSAVGLTALLAASRVAFDVLRIAGACYLLWLGVRALWTARRGRRDPAEPAQTRTSGLTAFRTGLTTNLLNPKVGVFYMSLLPQFVPDGASMFWTSVLFAAVHAAESLLWLVLIVAAAAAARRTLARPTVKRRLQQLTGAAFVAFGLRLATEH
ncbi:LysE family translocator [Actinomadura bangladeshensis]|uniref:LysE family translocator n=1 Tax=Actinomadura bangladeshensis TaxID=453573 RepID=A0A4R4NAW5_9ACTN|nr:LysE family translocator [Actinomadura bangladeshensis]TDC04543.1 LysE family translocator [Actinomadura bangladeshensis]